MGDTEFAFEGSVGQIRLNRPRRRNSLKLPMLMDRADFIAEAQYDGSIRVVTVTGAHGGILRGSRP